MFEPLMTYPLESYTYNGLIIPMEFFKPITEEMIPNILPIYWISNIGNVYNTRKNIFFNIKLNSRKYPQVTLTLKDHSQKCIHVHRLVCMAFHGMPSIGMNSVDHINGVKTCNFEDNLEWVTIEENTRRAKLNGLTRHKYNNHNKFFNLNAS